MGPIDAKLTMQAGMVPACPGWYRWWARDEVLRDILGGEYEALKPLLTEGEGEMEGWYHVYTGIAGNLKIRIPRWHLNQKHTDVAVLKGYLSTLRQSLAALYGRCTEEPSRRCMWDRAATDAVLSKLRVEWHPAETVDAAKVQEGRDMAQFVLPLNIQENPKSAKGGVLHTYTRWLKAQRRAAKKCGMEACPRRKTPQ